MCATGTPARCGRSGERIGPDVVLLDLGLPDSTVSRYAGGCGRAARSRSSWSRHTATRSTAWSARARRRRLRGEAVRLPRAGGRDGLSPFTSRPPELQITTLDRSATGELIVGPLQVVGRGPHRVTLDRAGSTDEVSLTPKEFELLALLAEDTGAVRTRATSSTACWDANWFGPTKTVDAHIRAGIRRKLGDGRWIAAVRGVGFRLEVPG